MTTNSHTEASGKVSRSELTGEELFQATYDQLRRLTQSLFRRERRNHTLQPTAVVHEAFLRLCQTHPGLFESREHFVAYAVRVIRQVLVDSARKHGAEKRGGNLCRVTLAGLSLTNSSQDPSILDLEKALKKLEAIDDLKPKIIEYRYFGGLSIEETATAVGKSVATVNREWRTARAWLLNELRPQSPTESA